MKENNPETVYIENAYMKNRTSIYMLYVEPVAETIRIYIGELNLFNS
jgi:hypothetical protein